MATFELSAHMTVHGKANQMVLVCERAGFVWQLMHAFGPRSTLGGTQWLTT